MLRKLIFWWSKEIDPQFLWGLPEEWSDAERYYYHRWHDDEIATQ